MADPRLARLTAAASGTAPRLRPLLSPQQVRERVPGPKAQPAPSLWDQVSGMVTGLPGGIIGMGTEAAQSLAGFPRLAAYEAGGLLRGEGIKKPHEGFAENLGEFFPLLESFRHSGTETGYRISHPGEYVKAAQEGRIIPALVEDAANVSIFAAPAAKLAGAAAGATAEARGVATAAAEAQAARAGAQVTAKAGADVGVRAAGEAGAKVGAETGAQTGAEAGAEGFAQARRARFQPRFLTPQRFPHPSELSPELVARPGVLRVGQAIERAARPAVEVANAPARIWGAPFKLAKGVELPERLFGTTAEGAPRQFGIKPALDRFGVTKRVMEQPSVAAAAEQFGDWRERRRQARDLRTGALAPAAAKVHVAAVEIQRELEPARRILGDDVDLTYANHLIHAGMTGVLEQLPKLRDRIESMRAREPDLAALDPDAAVGKVLAETFGLRQSPSEAAIGHVLDYKNGTMDPALRSRFDQAWEFEKRALDKLEQVKLERGQLNPAQLLDEPMQHRVDLIEGRTQERIQALKDEIEGTTDASGDYTPGLRARVAEAQRLVPTADLSKLAGVRAMAKARAAGAVESEVARAGAQAQRAYTQAEEKAAQADRARQTSLAGTREELAQLHRQQYGYEMGPEWTQGQLQTGRAERAAGATEATGLTVPEREYQLSERLARLEGEGRTRGVEQAAPRAAAARERAAVVGERAAGARGAAFTEAAQPVFQAEPALPFGQVSEADRAMFERPPAPDAPVTPEHRAEVAQARDEVARAAEQAKITHSDDLAGMGASVDATGKPTIGYVPDRWRAQRRTLMQQQGREARSGAQIEAARRRQKYPDRPGHADFIEGLDDAEWALIKRHRRDANPNDLLAVDQMATQLANREGRVRADVSEDMAAEAMMAGLKRWENAEDLAHGVKPRWPDELDNTMELSAADRAMAEALPERGKAQVALRRIPDAVAEAMVRARREGAAGEHADVVERMLPESRLGPSPWAMEQTAFTQELAGVFDELAPTIDLPPEQWTPAQVQANTRLTELLPDAIGDWAGLSDTQIYDRIHQAAELAGRDVAGPRLKAPPEAPGARLAAAGEAGRGEVAAAEARATEAVAADERLRETAAEQGEPVNTQSLARTTLSRIEQAIYDDIVSGNREATATARLGEARQKLTAGTREAGEAAGQRVGEAEGAQRVLTKQAQGLEARAETLAPKVEPALEAAQGEVEAVAQRGVNFGERVGKRVRDVQNRQRLLRTREKQLAWLEDERLPQVQARLAEGPREVSPGRYAPAQLSAERMYNSLQRMGNDLAVQTGNPWLSGEFWDLMGDVPQTMAQLHERGIYPEYIAGAVDEPTKGGRTSAGGEQQLPWSRYAPSEQRKRYGHIPQQVRTLHRSMVNDWRVMVEKDTAILMRDKWARTGTDIIDELVQRGELDPARADILRGPNRDQSVDFAKEMEEVGGGGYTAWDPESPRLPTDRQAGPDSYYLPTPMAQEFQRWWKPSNPNGAVRVYDQITRGFKHGVLAMSPSWQVNNIMGNAFMAVVFGGESPVAIYRATREVLGQMRKGGAEVRQLFPVPERPGRLSRTGRAVVNRVGPLRRGREWARDVSAAPPVGPPRLYGAGAHAEISRQFAEMTEPRTGFGRGLQKAYRANELVDNVGRTALYMVKRGKGYSDEAAVGMALDALGDFHNMTRFERDIVRRIIPFYAWMRHITKASLKLAVEHPWRTAWLLHLSDLFNPEGQDTGIPEYMRGGLGLGNGGFIPFGGANPLQGNVGSLFTSPKQWPGEFMRSLNPAIKLPAAAVGINLSQGRAVTRPPGTGPLDVYGRPMWSWQSPQEIAYMALRQVPQGRLVTDLAYNPTTNEVLPQPVLRYDTGHVIKRQGRPIPQTGGRFGGVVRNLGIPFFPTYVDEAQLRARVAKGRAAAAKAERSYNR